MGIDLQKLKEAFLNEAEDHTESMNKTLVALEKNPNDAQLFHNFFRAVHTLKSLAASMEYHEMVNVCHKVEDLLDSIRHKTNNITTFIDVFFQCVDFFSDDLKAIAANQPELDASNLLKLKLKDNFAASDSVPPIKINQPLQEFSTEDLQTIAVKVERLDILMNLAEELLVNKMKFDLIKEEVEHPELIPAIESLGRLITDLQYYVLQVRLVPIGFVFNRFIRLVRDLAKLQNKMIDLVIEGSDIELDRVLVDEIGASLAHLIKNAIDHGIETAEVRRATDKNPTATIKLSATRTKENAIIEVSDDGAGIDLDAIKSIAVKQKILSPNASEQDIINSMFTGISTTKNVTAISGRGLGLAIVKQKIESIGGRLTIQTRAKKGTSFFLEIPLTLAIIRTLFVKVSNQIYALPIDFVERLLVVPANGFKGLLEAETIIYQDIDIPVVRLSHLFGLKASSQSKQPLVIIYKGQDRLALAVDTLLTTQEVVIKPLSNTVKENKYFSGSAVIGSGQMILIIDAAYLLASSKERSSNLVENRIF